MGVTRDQVRDHVRESADLDRHRAWLRRGLELDVETVFFHNGNREQRRFVDDFGGDVLPAFHSSAE